MAAISALVLSDFLFNSSERAFISLWRKLMRLWYQCPGSYVPKTASCKAARHMTLGSKSHQVNFAYQISLNIVLQYQTFARIRNRSGWIHLLKDFFSRGRKKKTTMLAFLCLYLHLLSFIQFLRNTAYAASTSYIVSQW